METITSSEIVIPEIEIKVSSSHLDKYLTLIENNDVKKVILLLTNDSNAITDIVNVIQLIIVDNKIDSSDIHLFITLVKKIINLRGNNFELKDLTFVHFLNIVKVVIEILVKENMINLKNSNEFLDETTKIINLLITSEETIKKVGCAKCLPF
jgi:hypothetical protein